MAIRIKTTSTINFTRQVADGDALPEMPGTVKPATGRPYIPAFSLSGTVPVFFLRIYATTKVRPVCLRLREQCLRSEITSVARVAHVLLLLLSPVTWT